MLPKLKELDRRGGVSVDELSEVSDKLISLNLISLTCEDGFELPGQAFPLLRFPHLENVEIDTIASDLQFTVFILDILENSIPSSGCGLLKKLYLDLGEVRDMSRITTSLIKVIEVRSYCYNIEDIARVERV
jgi:hypothetical protein